MLILPRILEVENKAEVALSISNAFKEGLRLIEIGSVQKLILNFSNFSYSMATGKV